jgi:UDP-2,3-diacylglucosamine pyrophosphatase LpxH
LFLKEARLQSGPSFFDSSSTAPVFFTAIVHNLSESEGCRGTPVAISDSAREKRVLAPQSGGTATAIRTLFISDTHLGSRFARAEELLRFLHMHAPETIYLVGDIVDGWLLERRWHWPPVYDRIMQRLDELAESGTTIRYAPGNHDDFLRRLEMRHPHVEFAEQFVHTCADGRRLLILHGDQFDDVESHGQWLSRIGNVGYDALLTLDRTLNGGLRRLGAPNVPVSRWVKQSVKRIVQFISGFERQVVERAREHDCVGAVCGHIHVPKHQRVAEIEYLNLGDWVESCTAAVEYQDGALELLHLESRLARERRVPRVLRPVLLPIQLAPVATRAAFRALPLRSRRSA